MSPLNVVPLPEPGLQGADGGLENGSGGEEAAPVLVVTVCIREEVPAQTGEGWLGPRGVGRGRGRGH